MNEATLSPYSISPKLRHGLKWICRMGRSPFYFGNQRRCPVCERKFRRFSSLIIRSVWPLDLTFRKEAQCPGCNALERHRFLWFYLSAHTDLFTRPEGKLLHVAPEPCFMPGLASALGDRYVTADLLNPDVDIRVDVLDLPFAERSHHAVICNHVLEHVDSDVKAISEFYRILEPGGWAVLNVPVTVEQTIEDPSVTDPAERERLFGQSDHVRAYGPDYVDRLHAAGFEVEVIQVGDQVSSAEARVMGFTPATGEIYLCRKPADAHAD